MVEKSARIPMPGFSQSARTSSEPKSKQRYRAVFISDVHLGFSGSNATFLLNFLHSVECETLYLVGDIVDIWQLKKKPYWPQAHNDVIRTILGKAKYGTKIIYVPGNHDQMLRAYTNLTFGNISVLQEAIHERADGSRLLVTHGDQFDAAVISSPWLGMLGSQAYALLLVMNTWVNSIRRLCGMPYWSLAKYLKHKVKNAVQAINNFEHAVTESARREGVDGVVCGHIHRPEINRLDGITYCNCGDWVESCTALVEHQDGQLELIEWTDEQSIVEPLRHAA